MIRDDGPPRFGSDLRSSWIFLLCLPAWVYALTARTLWANNIAIVITAWALLFRFFMNYSMHRSRRRFARLDGRVCLKCGFDLTGLENEGTCPECGAAYRDQRELARRLGLKR